MATRLQIRCVNKTDRTNPDERISHVGGLNGDGTPWRLTEDAAIAGIENGTYTFFVTAGGNTVNVIVAKSSRGNKYLKTVADGERPDNLLSQLECK